MSIITELAELLAARWRTSHFRTSCFPQIAAEGLRELALEDNIEALLGHVFLDREGKSVPDHPSPDIAPIYSNAHFVIYLHAWIDGFAPLHQHEWAGAYQVLMGNSLDAVYSYAEADQVHENFGLGDLTFKRIDNMCPGDVREVEPGPGFIHSLSYNTKASFAISVRARAFTGETGRDYWRPGVAVETLGMPGYVRARRKAIRALYYTDQKAFHSELRNWLVSADLREVFYALEAVRALSPGLDGMGAALRAAEREHGERFHVILEASAETANATAHANARRVLPDDETAVRTFLSAVFTCRTRETILFAMATAGVRTTSDLLFQLVQRTLESGGHRFESWSTGVELLLRHAMRTSSKENTLSALRVEFEDSLSQEDVNLAEQLYSAMQKHPIVGTLFGN